jgi:hypothetical protein
MNAIRNLSIAAATVAFAASSAFAAQPAAGEGPFFEVTAGDSTVARVVVTQAPLAGEQPFVAVAAQSDVTRAEVRADLQMARANGDLPVNGETL